MEYINSCRICLSVSETLIGIFEVCTGLTLSEKIMYCASVEINPIDCLPKYICSLCRSNLDIAFKFKTDCEESNKKLQKSIDMGSINETIRDEIIFFDDSSLLREEIVASTIETDIKMVDNNYEDISGSDNVDLIALSNPENLNIKTDNGSELKPLNNTDEKVVVIQMNANIVADISKSMTEKLSKSPVGRHIAKKNSSQIPRKINRCPEALSKTLKSEIKLLNQFESIKTAIAAETKEIDSSSFSEISSDELDNQFICSICNKYYETYKQLMRHIKTHSKTKIHVCKICSKGFKNKYNLSVHSLKHSGKFPLKCAICKRGFANKSILKRHSISHNNETPFRCKYCMKGFPYEYSLRVHESIHIHRPTYTCNICFKIFSYKNSLSAHLKSHSGEKPHECKVCSHSFTRNSSLKRHMMQNHETSRLLFPEQEFQPKQECKSHENIIHVKLKCDFCSRKFIKKALLLKHLKMHKNFPCKLCKKIYKSNNALLLHYKRIHKNIL